MASLCASCVGLPDICFISLDVLYGMHLECSLSFYVQMFNCVCFLSQVCLGKASAHVHPDGEQELAWQRGSLWV